MARVTKTKDYNLHNSWLKSIKTVTMKYLTQRKDVHQVLMSNNFHEINKHEGVKEYLKGCTIIAILGADEQKNSIEYTFCVIGVGYNQFLAETKPFNFTGTKEVILQKRMIMFMYMHSHKWSKEKILTFSFLGEGVTRANFTKTLTTLSVNVRPLLDLIILERLEDCKQSPAFW